MTPKLRRLKIMKRNRMLLKTRRIVFGIVYLSLAIGAIAFILRAL